MRIRLSTVSSDRMKQLADGAHKWIPCAEIYRGQRVNIWRTSRGQVKKAKAEVIIRACFI